MNLDAYTVRKIAPRLLLAIVAVNLSIYLCVGAIDITTVVGHGLSQMIRGPFDVAGALDVNLDQGSSNLSAFFMLAGGLGGLGLSAVALSGGPIPMIFMSLLPIMLAVIAVIVTIAVRQALLVLLTLVSPIAIACLVLPGTEKYFKQWWDLFLKTLIVYPIIAGLFAVSDVMASILLNASNRPKINNIEGASDIIVGFILTVLPLFLIPFAFKFSGGVLGSIVNGANQMSQPFIRLARRKRQQGLEAGWHNVKTGNFIHGSSRFARRASSVAQTMALAPNALITARPRERLARLRQEGYAAGGAKLGEDPAFKEGAVFDDLLRAGLSGHTRQQQENYLMRHDRGGMWQDPARRRAGVEWIQQQHRKAGYGGFRQAAIHSLATNSTAFSDHADAIQMAVSASRGDPANMVALWKPIMDGQAGVGRPVVGGGSFSKVVQNFAEAQEDMARNGGELSQATRDRLNARAARSVWGRMGGPRTFASNKPTDAKALTTAAKQEYTDIASRLALPENHPDRVMEMYDPGTDSYVNRPVTENDRLAALAKMETAYENARSNGNEVRSQVASMLESSLPEGTTVPVHERMMDAEGEEQVVQTGERRKNFQDEIQTVSSNPHYINLLYSYKRNPAEAEAALSGAAQQAVADAAANAANPPG